MSNIVVVVAGGVVTGVFSDSEEYTDDVIIVDYDEPDMVTQDKIAELEKLNEQY